MALALRSGERTGPEGKPISNRLLLLLGDKAFGAIRPALKHRVLEHHVILHEANRKAGRVYFPDSGLISLVVVMSNGKTAEAGVVGNEGVVGLEGLFGIRRSLMREVVQVAGSAHSIETTTLEKLFRANPELPMRLSRFAIVNRMQISQTAACNRLHEVVQRLSRWLLMTQDRVDSGFIPMTHDFLAVMLGTDRSSVTEAAGVLQRRNAIEYTRGAVRVLNRKSLEQSSCECYRLIREYNAELVR
jgi:CRP-like cAMP-binding protein